MNLRKRQQAQTRRDILEAVGEVLEQDGLLGFSMQKVADRAGVTHRTVYNYFPTRESLNDAFAVHVEEELAKLGEAPDAGPIELSMVPRLAGGFGRAIAGHETSIRAYAMLMIANRAPSEVMRARTKRFERLLKKKAGPLPPNAARLATCAVRMFLSSVGWHVSTELHGLSIDEADRMCEWASRVLLDAVKRGDFPKPSTTEEKR
jgi:AcrR family transcriptional regulator